MNRRRSMEAKLQAKCTQWLWNTRPQTRGCFLLIDNNASSMIGTLQKRAMGMVKGAADTMFFWNKKIYFIEFKVGKNVQTKAQKEFEIIAEKHAEKYVIIREFEDFIELIKSILRQ